MIVQSPRSGAAVAGLALLAVIAATVVTGATWCDRKVGMQVLLAVHSISAASFVVLEAELRDSRNEHVN